MGLLIYWRFHRKPEPAKYIGPSFLDAPISTKTICSEKTNVIDNEADQALAEQIQKMLEQQNMYLQTNLKVADLARHLSVSGYRVRRIFRHHFNARNFNQFINEMRIKHARTLLKDPENAQWPILEVGLESGFASVETFSRAFKSICDMTPNQYRQFYQSRTEEIISTVVRVLFAAILALKLG
jgi:AraC-like DNA-binding protein